MTISKDTEQVLLGGMLGDSWIKQNGKGRGNYYLSIAHCPKQLDYLTHKFNFFAKEGLTTPKGIFSVISNKKYLQYRFYTKTLPFFNTYHHLFYPSGKKVVTRHILNMLDPLGLAIWFMDDGSRNIVYYTRKTDGIVSIRTRKLEWATDSFTLEEHHIIKDYFKVVWGIDVNIHKSKKSHKLAINATNAKIFIEIIKPHVVPCMQYKIDLQYNVTVPSGDMIYSELDSDIQNSAEMTESLDENEVI